MKKIAIFLLIAVLCFSMLATSCRGKGKNEKTESKGNNVTENVTKDDVNSPSESENGSEKSDVTSENITTEETTEEYEEMTEGAGVIMPEVPI